MIEVRPRVLTVPGIDRGVALIGRVARAKLVPVQLRVFVLVLGRAVVAVTYIPALPCGKVNMARIVRERHPAHEPLEHT